MSPNNPKNTVAKSWFVYVLYCADGTLYTGITTDTVRRVQEHNSGAPRGARYTRSRRPVILAYTESVSCRSAATRREWAIKQLDHSHKLALCAPFSAHTDASL